MTHKLLCNIKESTYHKKEKKNIYSPWTKFSLFQNSNFLLLEHWPKFNTDTNVNFLGQKYVCQVNFMNFV